MLTQKQIEGIAEDALQLAIEHIQAEIGVSRGDVAAAVFSDNHVMHCLSAYIMTELASVDTRPRVNYVLPDGSIGGIIFDHGETAPPTTTYTLNGKVHTITRADLVVR